MSGAIAGMTQEPAAADPATRGVTRVSPHVVERIAAYACHRATAAVTPQLEPNAPRSVAPRARAEINGRLARLSVSVGVRYPAPVAAFAASVRSVVTTDVENLCGLRVVGIDVEAAPVNIRQRTRVL
jgi:hypothetical protein